MENMVRPETWVRGRWWRHGAAGEEFGSSAEGKAGVGGRLEEF